ncbi:MAG: lipoprotein [Gammaproteobacteria bacterium]|nr:lipoprotein [Gammaproteobacteria bacterium]MCP5139672.1 lipoprotein [Chromatiales bacterium]
MLRAGTALMMAFTLAACGLKGDLYLPPPEAPAGSVAAPVAADADTDQADRGERKTIPATPDPALSR